MTDAYAFLKVFVRQCAAQGIARPMPYLVVNRAQSEEEAKQVARRLQNVVSKFLGARIELLAVLPDDRAALRAIQRRSAVVDSEPESELSRAIVTLSCGVAARLAHGDAAAGARLAMAAHGRGC